MSIYRIPQAIRIPRLVLIVFAFTVFVQTAFTQEFEVRFARPSNLEAAERLPNGPVFQSAGDGDLDPTFNPAAELASGFLNAIEELPNGKVLVAGGFRSINGFGTNSVARFNSNRTLDTSFAASIRGTVFRIAVLPDGKILIAGAFTAFSATTSRTGIARLNADGSLDTTFDSGTGADGTVRDMALQPDGKILLAGSFFGINGVSRYGFARLLSDGTVDATLTSPFTPTGPGSSPVITSVGLQSDGRIIVGGQFNIESTFRWLVRLNTNGSPDGSFTPPTMPGGPLEFAIQADNKIVMVGSFANVNGVSRPRLARLNAEGTLDESFNAGTGPSSGPQQIRLLASGQFVITGTFTTVNTTARPGVAIINSNGALDTTFAPSGTSSGPVSVAAGGLLQ